jgi:hypothetical protein
MKCLVIIIITLSSHFALAAKNERELLKCLGAEEKKFHLKKETGPLYDLNQRLISEMIQIPKAELSGEAFDDICRKSASPSWRLLELALTKGQNIFEVPREITGTQREVAQGMISDFIEITSEIFLNLLTQIQALAPTPKCLEEEIPEISSLMSDIKHLQEDVDIKSIFSGRDKKIFDKLKNYSEAYKNCQLRAKKKLRSGSKPRDKKS